ncbi:PEGA domain-containing protein [Methanoculleus sediminis]|uniref:PEGA domain-containing protein n=1 Tax=Methanoculleus sediminis TaxID=1550566 RepID=UPI0009E62DB9|nr:PEGA domain-containing protein [Methanoculleus sediminis]
MRSVICIVVLLTLIASCGCTSVSPSLITVSSEPNGAEVYLDSEYHGSTPCSISDVSVGVHSIELRHPDYITWKGEVTVGSGESVVVSTALSKNTASDTIASSTNVGGVRAYTSDSKVQRLEQIVEDYHNTHTYSMVDLFVCADMAIDVWNMVETAGINAKIAVGNIERANSGWSDWNHAWVLAEVDPSQWVALETTGGYLVYGDANSNYYRAVFFDTPKDFKEYLNLIRDYSNKVSYCNTLYDQYNVKAADYNRESAYYSDMVNYWNTYYMGQPVSTSSQSYQSQMTAQAMRVSSLLGELNQITNTINAENAALTRISNQIVALIS